MGIDISAEIEVNLSRCIKEWVINIDTVRPNKTYNLRIFETIREEIIEDVEINEVKKQK